MTEQIMLYPPQLEGSIPSFYGTELSVPFSMNRSVSTKEVAKFRLKIKTLQSNTFLFFTDSSSINMNNHIVKFNIGDDFKNLNIGQFYKIQIAYIDQNDVVGYFSNSAIVKYTSEPQVTIEGLTKTEVKNLNGTCVGKYTQTDTSERVFSYCFNVYNKDKILIETSDFLIHNAEEDDYINHTSIDSYKIKTSLVDNETYYIEYIIITNNNLQKSSGLYPIGSMVSIPSELDAQLFIENNFSDGFIQLSLESNENNLVSGNFVISRADSLTNYNHWDEVYKFYLNSEIPTIPNLWRDFTVQQGINYKYSIQQYNNAIPPIYSTRIVAQAIVNGKKTSSNYIEADFEDAFLFDGKKQLKIKYNPKINNFKTDVLEAKIDTIGSKHPFIYRNGNVYYKEFSISGLISYLMDENNFFLTEDELGLTEEFNEPKVVVDLIPHPVGKMPNRTDKKYKNNQEEFFKDLAAYNLAKATAERKEPLIEGKKINLKIFDTLKPRTTNLVSYNIAAERIFKLAVLDWLNNGEPKLFRSPTEGNYIVRLLNSSLAPTDSLNRMLHTFTSTAYEVSEFNYDNLNNFAFVEINNPIIKQDNMETIDILKEYLDEENKGELLKHMPVNAIYISDGRQGDAYDLVFSNGEVKTIVLGVTGTYQAADCEIFSIKVHQEVGKEKKFPTGLLTYSYVGSIIHSSFDEINAVTSKDLIFTYPYGSADENILANKYLFNNIKDALAHIYLLDFRKNPIFTIYSDSENEATLLQLVEKDLPYSIYQVVSKNPSTIEKYKTSLVPTFQLFAPNKYGKVPDPATTPLQKYYIAEKDEDTNEIKYLLAWPPTGKEFLRHVTQEEINAFKQDYEETYEKLLKRYNVVDWKTLTTNEIEQISQNFKYYLKYSDIGFENKGFYLYDGTNLNKIDNLNDIQTIIIDGEEIKLGPESSYKEDKFLDINYIENNTNILYPNDNDRYVLKDPEGLKEIYFGPGISLNIVAKVSTRVFAQEEKLKNLYAAVSESDKELKKFLTTNIKDIDTIAFKEQYNKLLKNKYDTYDNYLVELSKLIEEEKLK